jgi:hypothetical protein
LTYFLFLGLAGNSLFAFFATDYFYLISTSIFYAVFKVLVWTQCPAFSLFLC